MKTETNARFKINDFIYDEIREKNISSPTIVPIVAETYSQCYEDIIIESLFRAAVASGKIKQENITYIDIGANHPISTSASYLFYKHYGITGILVEANPDLIQELKTTRPKDTIIESAVVTTDVAAVDFYIGNDTEVSGLLVDVVDNWKQQKHKQRLTVPAMRINNVLKQSRGKHIILTIDVEGYDYEILNDIDFDTYSPWLIQVEPSDWIISGNSNRIANLLSKKGYHLISETDVNQLYIKLL